MTWWKKWEKIKCPACTGITYWILQEQMGVCKAWLNDGKMHSTPEIVLKQQTNRSKPFQPLCEGNVNLRDATNQPLETRILWGVTNVTRTERSKDVEHRTSFTASEIQNCTLPLENSMAVSIKQNYIFLLCNTECSFLQSHLKELKTPVPSIYTNPCWLQFNI